MTTSTTAVAAAIRGGQELLCVTDADRRVVVAAGPWEAAAGADLDAVRGVLMDDLVRADDRPTFRIRHEAALAGLPHLGFDVALASGQPGRVHEMVLTVEGPHVVVSLRDVTHQRRTERNLAALNDRLAHANAELLRSNAELERFAYVASHDLSEPLRMVTSYCDLLVSHYGDVLDDQAREYVAFATDGAVRMRALIDDLLTYARVATESTPPVEVDLAAVFAAAVRDLAPAIDEAGAVVVVDPLPTVSGHPSQLRQLAANLLTNAVKFRSPAVSPRIHVRARRDGAHVTLSVSDNGIGVEARYRDRIFEMFKRLHSRGAYDGNGIGLALCKRIAERHNGRIWLDPADGGGSTFRVTLHQGHGLDVTT